MKKALSNAVLFLVGFIGLSYVISCKKIEILETTTTDVNLYQYLKQNPGSFSLFAQIVEKSGYSGFLNAYGSYTLFTPTDDGVKAYLTEANKASVDQITEQEAQSIVKFHIIEDTLITNMFKDGKLPLPTMLGQYLVTGVSNVGGKSSFQINRQALVTQGNIRTGNGYIHVIDKVLKPPTKTIAQQIDTDPRFSIFKQALDATGFYAKLNTVDPDTSKRWMTVMAETNEALRAAGINSYTDLRNRYSNTGNPANPEDSLYIYVAYHIVPGARYLADIVTANSHPTFQPLEVISSKLDGEKVLINDIIFNGVYEQGAELERSTSDVSATNGVLHTALSHYHPKVRVAAPVYWDVADFPEIRKLPAYFRKRSYAFDYGSIKDINWDKTGNRLDYVYTTASNQPVVYNDYLAFPMGNTSRNFWMDFTTPLVVKGRYKVWICYRAAKQSGSLGAAGGSNMPCQVYFNGEPLRTFAFTEQRPNLSDGEMEALGWKRYTVNTAQYMSGRFVGTVDVKTTDRHTIRIQALPAAGTGQNSNWLDMIHLIPINMEQYLPRFDRDGTMVYN